MKSVMVLFGLVILVLIAGVAKKTGWITYDEAKTLSGVIFGLMMIAAANIIPKTVPPLSERRGRAALGIAMERDAGWILVLGGVTSILIWLTAPAQMAQVVAPLIGLLAFGLTGLNAAFLWWREKRIEAKEDRL